MTEPLLIANLALVVLTIILVLVGLYRRRPVDPRPFQPQFDSVLSESRRIEQALRDELHRQREESGRSATGLRDEVSNQLRSGSESLLNRQDEARRAIETRLDSHQGVTEQRLHAHAESN